MSGVQFIGKKAILDCYQDMDLEQFAFFQGKELIVSGSGVAELEKWCDRFSMAGSAATYKFRLYEDLGDEKIKPTTEYVCSFEVKFSDPYGGNGVVGGWGHDLLGRMEKLEKKVDGGDSDGGNRIMDAVMGWFEEPSKLQEAVGALKMIVGMGQATPQPAAIAGMVEPSRIITPDQEANAVRLSNALDTIEKHDPRIVQHMEKLAAIAVKKPETFTMLLGMLDNF